MSATNRDVLRVDEHGKNIVWESRDVFIAVNDPRNATYLTLWVCGKKVGFMGTRTYPGMNEWLGVATVEVEKRYRGRGYGTQLYREALRFMSEKYKGLVSHLPDRANKKQVPAIYRRLGGYAPEGDYAFVMRCPVIEAAPLPSGSSPEKAITRPLC